MLDEGESVDEAKPSSAPEFNLWPENVPVWHVWLGVQTQWRANMESREGLDYCGVRIVMRAHRIAAADRDRTFLLVQGMERAALEEWAEQRKRSR